MGIVNVYFSPTGGTKKVSDILANSLTSTPMDIDLSNPDFASKIPNLSKDDLVIIAMPSFGGRAPQVAIERLKLIKGNKARCILTCVYGNRDFEDTLLEMYNTALSLDFHIIGAVAAIARHSIATEYASNRPDEADQKQLIEFMQKVSTKESLLAHVPGNYPYKKLSSFKLIPKTTKVCTNCKQCVRECPVLAINYDTLVTDSNLCISCMRCVNICPQGARKINPVLQKGVSLALKKSCSIPKEIKFYE